MDSSISLVELTGLEIGAVNPVVTAQRYNWDKGAVTLGGVVCTLVFKDREGIAGGLADAFMVVSNLVDLPC